MSLLVHVYKANKKEWDDFSNGKNVFIYDMVNAKKEEVPPLTELGIFHGCEFKFMLGGMLDEAIYDHFIVVETERLVEVMEECERKKDDVAMSWCMAVLNTLADDETIIIECD